MITIAVTGGIASGKSLLGEILQNLGYTVIDLDTISKDISRKGEIGYKGIVEIFGKIILQENGEIDRKKLADIVFNDKQSLNKLNAAMHPLIDGELNKRLRQLKDEKYVFVLIPLLFETGWQNRFDRVWLILADKDKRIERAQARDGLTREEIESRMRNQINHADYIRFAHNVLYNNNSGEGFKEQILKALNTL